MTTVRAASSAMPSVASVPRKAAEARHREAAAQEEARREVVAQEAVQEALLRERRGVAAVAPAAMRTTSMHRAAVAEVEGDDFLVTKPTKPSKQWSWEQATARNRLPLPPRLTSVFKTQSV